jgi:hypothetical protein
MAQGAVQPLLQRLKGNRPEEGYSPDEVRELLAACRLGAVMLDHVSDAIELILRRGIESRKLKSVLQEVRNNCTLWPGLHSQGAALPVDEKAAGLQRMDEFTARAALICDKVAKLQQFLEQPGPQIDLASITGRGPSPPTHQSYQDVEEIIARLMAGGDA